MINRLKTILLQKDYSDWKVLVREVRSNELFYIKKKLDQSREVSTLEAVITLYKDFFSEDGKLRGQASASFHPTFSDKEISEKLDKLYMAAGAAGSPWYPLPEAADRSEPFRENSVYERHSLAHWTTSLAEALFKGDKREQSWINSLEIFLSEIRESFLNSRGIEYQYSGYEGLIDLVTTARDEEGKEAELHREEVFSAYEPEELTLMVKRQLEFTEDRVKALSLTEKICPKVIIREDALTEFFAYWLSASSGEAVYRKIHTTELGNTLFAGEGTAVSLIGLNHLYNAPQSRPFDADGLLLSEQEIFSDSRLAQYHVGAQFSFYMGIPATGRYSCFSILPGDLTEEQLYRDPYLEVISFSDFQMDPVTGDFGGEIRLAYLYDGKSSLAVTGGSVTGSLRECAPAMRFSDQVKQRGNMLLPEAVLISGMHLTPAE